MKKKSIFRFEYFVGALLFLLFYLTFAFLLQEQTSEVLVFVKDHAFWGAVLYVVFFAISVVFVPLSSVPFVLFTEEVWGVFLGGTLSALGWWIGGILLFSVARYLGRPFLSRFISFKKMDQWEKSIPEQVTFIGIVLSHMVLPAEVPSFAFGLVKPISFRVYALASFFGIFPISYLLVATGGAVFSKNWLPAIIFGAVLGVVFLAAFFLWWKYFWKRK